MFRRFFKALAPLRFPRQHWSTMLLPRTNFRYDRAVNNGRSSNLVTASVGWVARQFTEAPLKIFEYRGQDNMPMPVTTHMFYDLWERPNSFYYGINLVTALVGELYYDGNAYIYKRRNEFDQVIEIWWLPSTMVEPVWDDEPSRRQIEEGRDFIDHYEYRPDSLLDPVKINRRDIMHFRWGIDSQNQRKGLSPLKAVLREVFTDEEAANFSAALLKNMGVPGVILSPADNETTEPMSDEDIEAVKRDFLQRFSGDRRGEPMVMDAAVDVNVVSFSPQQMDLAKLRRIPEERVSAVTGIHAAVVGLGSGLETMGNNYQLLLESTYQTTIMFLQRLIEPVLRNELLKELEGPTLFRRRFLKFDNTNVQILQRIMNEKAKRHGLAILYGWEEVGEGRFEFGLPVRESDRIFLRRKGTYAVQDNNVIESSLPEVVASAAEGTPEDVIETEI